MITHNRIKTNIFSTLIGLLFSLGYLYFYINGTFGKALFDWSFFSGLIMSIVHPVSLIGLVPFIIIIYLRSKKNFHLGYENMIKSIILHLTVLVVTTIIIVIVYFIDKQIALIYAFIYFFIIGFFSSYLVGIRLFAVKDSEKRLNSN